MALLNSVKDMDAGISEKLIKLHQPFELDPLKCVGKGYDGASVMSGIHGGVEARMKGAGYATYVHCASHRLNLVLAATAERHPMIKSFFDTLGLTRAGLTSHEARVRFSARGPRTPRYENLNARGP